MCFVKRRFLIKFSLFILLVVCVSISFKLLQYSKSQLDESRLQCSKLFIEKTKAEDIKSGQKWKTMPNDILTDSQMYSKINFDCTEFLWKQKYFLKRQAYNSENHFRIAFSMMISKSASQVERLIRTIYRPWNYYCIHIDLNATSEFIRIIQTLVKCLYGRYENIVILNKRVHVRWNTMSELTAELNCLRALYLQYKDWKYLINLTGQEFPLKTNSELVEILKAFKGANDIDGTYTNRQEDLVPQIKFPFALTWYKGSTHIIANRAYIQFIVESDKADNILNVLNDKMRPAEHFFSTINYNPQLRIPGTFAAIIDKVANTTDINSMARFKKFGKFECNSRNADLKQCIFGVADLSALVRAPHLFGNVFDENYQPGTLKCLEMWYYEKVAEEEKTKVVRVDSLFYSSLPLVKYRLKLTRS